ncbi:hypothetical protein C2845_PM01G20440 [Panicum miliaceum]|uniref:Uncharacterized protein n=1 Tax=Panicum miliaceum TaxID=4540 RepID=A0A3L6TNF4_PANMI|nr:hypothetical protein C2845_PM01G20440 [Panicum miliaceum]
MTRSQENAFIVAFVIYVMSTLLLPGAKHDYISVDYWNAIVDPSCIDWPFQGVVKVQPELASSKKVTNITGCSIFLQVLYLDSIDIGVLNIEQSSLPRIRHFTTETMKSMILADTLRGPDGLNECGFGKSQLRDPDSICYSWAREYCLDHSAHGGDSTAALWEVATSFSTALGVGAQAAGPLFFAVAEFNGDSNLPCCGGALSLTCVLSSIIEPFNRGFRYDSGRDFYPGKLNPICYETSSIVCTNWKRNTCYGQLPTSDISCCDTGDRQIVLYGMSHKAKKARICSDDQPSCSMYQSRQCPVDCHGDSYMKVRWPCCCPELLKLIAPVWSMSRYYLVLRCSNNRLCCGVGPNVVGSYTHGSKRTDVNADGGREVCLACNGVNSECEGYSGHRPVILHFSPKHIEVPLASFLHLLEGRSEGSILADSFDPADCTVSDQLAAFHIGYNVCDCKMAH